MNQLIRDAASICQSIIKSMNQNIINKTTHEFKVSVKQTVKVIRFISLFWESIGYKVIHQVRTKKIPTVNDVYTTSLISIDFDFDFISSFTPWFLFWFRGCSSAILKTPRILSSIFRCVPYFQLSSQCLNDLLNFGSLIWDVLVRN